MWDFGHIYFPCLKTLHLDKVDFKSSKYFVEFIYSFHILENSNAKSHICKETLVNVENLNSFPNLVNAKICYNTDNLMISVCKARILHVKHV